MSLASVVANNPAIDNLVQSSSESEHNSGLEWIPCSDITDIEPTQIDNAYYAVHNDYKIILVFLGSSEECTPALVSQFARIYSLPTHKYNNDVSRFRRYFTWLSYRNKFIKGFTEYDDKYYMVAKRQFYHYYSRYGFCS